MPPEDNTNKNSAGINNFRVGLDPVFKSNSDLQKTAPVQNTPTGAYNTLNNQQYVPPPKPEPIILGQTPLVNANPKSIVRTFKGDMESAIQANHLTSINIAIAENQKMREQAQNQAAAEPEVVAPESSYSKGKVIIFISLLLIIAGIIGIGVVYFINLKNSSPAAQVQELPSLITTEYKDELNTSLIANGKFVSAISSKLNDFTIPANNLYNTYITIGTSTTRRLINSTEFINLMNFKMPDLIKRTLLPDFMVGMYSFGKNMQFVILKTSYFENAYAGMLDWEKDLEKDFQIIFRLPGYESSGGILSGLTPTTKKVFTDGVIVNKDTRILKDELGQIILIYGIVDKETIIITTTDTAFKEIIDRLNKEKTLKR